MSIDIRRLTPTDIPLMYALLKTFGEGFNDADTYTANCPSEDYLRRLLDGDTFIALAALKNGAVVMDSTPLRLEPATIRPEGPGL